jgi:hypothetical protein
MPTSGFEAEAVKTPKNSGLQIDHYDYHRHGESTQLDFNSLHRAACVRQDNSHTVLPEIELFQGPRDAEKLATAVSEKAFANIKSPVMQDAYLRSVESFALGLVSGTNNAKDKSKAEIQTAWRDVSSGTIVDKVVRTKEAVVGMVDAAHVVIDTVCKDPLAPTKTLVSAALAIGASSEQFVEASPNKQGEVLGELAFWGFNPGGKAAEAREALVALGESKAITGLKGRYLELKEEKATTEFLESKILPTGDETKPLSDRIEGKPTASEKFIRQFDTWLSRVPRDHLSLLQVKGVSINPCLAVSHYVANGESTLGVYVTRGGQAVKDKSILVGETYLKKGEYLTNPDPEWTLRHEIGHALSHNLGNDGKRLSEDRRFIIAFEKDWSNLPPSEVDWFSYCYQDQMKKAQEEIFADLYAHHSGLAPSGTPHGRNKQSIKDFFPNCFRTMPKLLAPLEDL